MLTFKHVNCHFLFLGHMTLIVIAAVVAVVALSVIAVAGKHSVFVESEM